MFSSPPTVVAPLIYCKDCDQTLPAEKFPKNRARLNGRGYYCRQCHSARSQAWKKANPEKAGRTVTDGSTTRAGGVVAP